MNEIKNDDVLVFNTEQQTVTKQEIATFKLVDPTHPLMSIRLQEFDFQRSEEHTSELQSH